MRNLILKTIDFFYFPFLRKWISRRNFRYLFCGGGSTLVDIIVYFISYHYIIHERPVVRFLSYHVSGYIMAFIIAFCVSFPLGFILSKYVVFPESYLKGRIQLIRYLFIVGLNILFNYLLLHFFVQTCHIYPTIAKIIIVVILGLFSYFSQKYFTFRMEKGFYKEEKAAS